MDLFTLKALQNAKEKIVEQKNAELMFADFSLRNISSYDNYLHTFITHEIQFLGL